MIVIAGVVAILMVFVAYWLGFRDGLRSSRKIDEGVVWEQAVARQQAACILLQAAHGLQGATEADPRAQMMARTAVFN